MKSRDTIELLRRKIDLIDKKLVQLMNDRAVYARKIGCLKHCLGKSIGDPKRERVVLKRVSRLNRGPLTQGFMRCIFTKILSEMRIQQK